MFNGILQIPPLLEPSHRPGEDRGRGFRSVMEQKLAEQFVITPPARQACGFQKEPSPTDLPQQPGDLRLQVRLILEQGCGQVHVEREGNRRSKEKVLEIPREGAQERAGQLSEQPVLSLRPSFYQQGTGAGLGQACDGHRPTPGACMKLLRLLPRNSQDPRDLLRGERQILFREPGLGKRSLGKGFRDPAAAHDPAAGVSGDHPGQLLDRLGPLRQVVEIIQEEDLRPLRSGQRLPQALRINDIRAKGKVTAAWQIALQEAEQRGLPITRWRGDPHDPFRQPLSHPTDQLRSDKEIGGSSLRLHLRSTALRPLPSRGEGYLSGVAQLVFSWGLGGVRAPSARDSPKKYIDPPSPQPFGPQGGG